MIMALVRPTYSILRNSFGIFRAPLLRPQFRYARKGLRRKPISVIENEPPKDTDKKPVSGSFDPYSAYFEDPVEKEFRNLKIETPEVEYIHEVAGAIEEEETEVEGLPPYENLGEKNSEFIKAMTMLKSRKQREKKGLMLLEGKRLIADAILAGVKLTKLFFSKEENITELPLKGLGKKVKIMKVFYKDLQLWSDMTTSPGVMGVFKIPDYGKLDLPKVNLLPVTLVCHNVRDPGNMGSIIRCAAAAGCRRLLLTKGCVDLWEPKVLRSASGGHFRIDIVNHIDVCNLPDHLPENSKLFLADNNHDDPKKRAPGRFNIGSNLYTDVDYTNAETVLVIGGETEGLGKDILELCQRNSGERLHIPMLGEMESLNSAMAMAIILFEMKRQYREAGQLVSNLKFLNA